MVIFLSLGEGLRKVFTSELGGIGPDIQVSLNGFTQGLAPSPNLNESATADIQKLAPSLGISLVTPVVMSLRASLDPSQNVVFYSIPAAQGISAVFPKLTVAQGQMFGAAVGGAEGDHLGILGQRQRQPRARRDADAGSGHRQPQHGIGVGRHHRHGVADRHHIDRRQQRRVLGQCDRSARRCAVVT